MVYEEFDPFGNERLDLTIGKLTAAVMSVWGGEKQVDLADVVPDWGGLREKGRIENARSATLEDWLGDAENAGLLEP